MMMHLACACCDGKCCRGCSGVSVHAQGCVMSMGIALAVYDQMSADICCTVCTWFDVH